MFRIRGMEPFTLAHAFWVGCRSVPTPEHVFLCVADHFEPEWRGASKRTQQERVRRWVQQYANSTRGISDSLGRGPQHTFFYPVECYQSELVESLADLVRAGHGDIEVHLHHDNDNPESLRETLLTACDRLHTQHGLLSKDPHGQLRYGFIHGNWALDNSHPDGRWCGVNNELTILRETGCYADFTMPAAPHPAQTRIINSLYYAVDDPEQPKSHDTGQSVCRSDDRPPDSLLMIQGPTLITRSGRLSKLKLENGNLSGSQPPTGKRLKNWLRAAIAVRGQESWLFIKLHTHGAQEQNADVLLGPEMRQFHAALKQTADELDFRYYYVTAREMAQLVGQAERGFAKPDFGQLGWS